MLFMLWVVMSLLLHSIYYNDYFKHVYDSLTLLDLYGLTHHILSHLILLTQVNSNLLWSDVLHSTILFQFVLFLGVSWTDIQCYENNLVNMTFTNLSYDIIHDSVQFALNFLVQNWFYSIIGRVYTFTLGSYSSLLGCYDWASKD